MFSFSESILTGISVLVATMMVPMVAANGVTTTIDFLKTEEVVLATPQQFSASLSTITTSSSSSSSSSPPTSVAITTTLPSQSMSTPIFLVAPTDFQKIILDVDIVFSEKTDSTAGTVSGVTIAALALVSIAIALLVLLIVVSRRRHKNTSQILFDSFV